MHECKVEVDVTIMQLNHKSRLQLVLIHLYLLKVLGEKEWHVVDTLKVDSLGTVPKNLVKFNNVVQHDFTKKT